jgi:hypothetical protein
MEDGSKDRRSLECRRRSIFGLGKRIEEMERRRWGRDVKERTSE